jgi:hypothetical protein
LVDASGGAAGAAAALAQAEELIAAGDLTAAIERLTNANRVNRDCSIERKLVRLRRSAGRLALGAEAPPRRRIAPASPAGPIVEIAARDLTLDALVGGIAHSGCLLVRGLVTPSRADELARGIDATFDAYDSAESDGPVDPCWFEAHTMPDRESPGLPAPFRRRLLRQDGGLWTADSPRMLFETFEVMHDSGLAALMDEYFQERPLLSAIKGTLRRVAPFEMIGGWHQDGAFLGTDILSLNVWLALSECGERAPGLDIVPRRLDGVLPRDERAQFDWSVSDEGVVEAAADVGVVRPHFGPGDGLLFDHLLLHRTGADASMVDDRYAIESWFFAPSAYPDRQLPIYF